MLVRKAVKEDLKVVKGLIEFIESLELDIIVTYGKNKVLEILTECFLSEKDRFSYRYCNVVENENDILGFSFSYNYDDVKLAEKFWKEKILEKYNLSKDTIVFDYNEALLGEFYLDTLYVFSENRGKGVGSQLLKQFKTDSNNPRSLNVAQSNSGARKLYESFGFKKDGEIYIGNELYDHLILK